MNCLSKSALLFLLFALCSLPAFAQGPLRVSTSDGATTFNGVTELVFPPGSVTINGRKAQIGAGGGSGVPGSGISRLNGMIGVTQTFSSVNDTNVSLTIASASNIHTYTIGWIGTLAKARQHAATVYTDQANTFGAFLQKFQAGNNFNFVDPSDTTKVAKFDLSNIATATTRTVNIPDANSTTAQTKSAVAHFFFTAMSGQGVFSTAQPVCADLSDSAASCATDATNASNIASGTLSAARLPATTVYTDQANTFGAFLQKFQAGNNFNLVDPTDTTKVAKFDVSNIATATTRTVNIPNANSTTVQADTGASNNFLTAVSAQGVISKAQPACTNLSDASSFCSGTNAANLTGTLPAISGVNLTSVNAAQVGTTSTSTNATFYDLVVASSSNSNQVVNLNSGFGINPATGTRSAPNYNATTGGYRMPDDQNMVWGTSGTADAVSGSSATHTITFYTNSGARFTINSGGEFLIPNIAAPSTPASGKEVLWTDSTHKRFHDKNDAGTIGTTVVADTGASHNFLTGITTAGVITKAQPDISDITNAPISNAASLSTLSSAFTLTMTDGSYADTGLSVSLPGAGTFLIMADVHSAINGAIADLWINAKLYNSTDAADVANSETMCAYASTSAKYYDQTAPIHVVVTVAGAKTIKLYARRAGSSSSGDYTYSKIENSTSGRTRLSYLQVN